MYKFAEENVPAKLRLTFLAISDKSFGNRSLFTPRYPQKTWAKIIGISQRTFYTQINELAESGLIQINHSDKYMKEGGSEAFSYSPVYPKGYGKIMLKTDDPSKNTQEPRSSTWTKYEEI